MSFSATVGTFANASGVTSGTITPGSTVAAGRTLLVGITIANGTTGAVTVTDSKSNTYTSRYDQTNAGQLRLIVFVAENITSITGADTITLGFPNARVSAVCTSYNQVTNPSFDIASGVSTGSSGTPSCAVVTPSTNHSTLVGVFSVQETTATATSGLIQGGLGTIRSETINGSGTLGVSGSTVIQDIESASAIAISDSINITGSTNYVGATIVLKHSVVNALAVAGTLTSSGLLTKKTIKSFAGAIASAGVLAIHRVKFLNIAGSIAMSGVLAVPRAVQPHIKMGSISTLNHKVSAIITKVIGPSRPKLGG